MTARRNFEAAALSKVAKVIQNIDTLLKYSIGSYGSIVQEVIQLLIDINTCATAAAALHLFYYRAETLKRPRHPKWSKLFYRYLT